jgi:malonyl-CoA O-methyltransferase
MADNLVRLVSAKRGAEYPLVLEIGSGSGILTRRLFENFRIRELVVNDLVPECAGHIWEMARGFQSVTVRFIPGDIESLVSIPTAFDLITASATFQWVQDLPRLLKRLTSLLVPGGVLAFSTFGPDNLAEIRDISGESLSYHDADSLCAMLPEGLALLAIEEERTTLTFPSPMDVLEHIRSTGGNALARKAWTRASLAEFERAYRTAYRHNGGVGLTYHPITIAARNVMEHLVTEKS